MFGTTYIAECCKAGTAIWREYTDADSAKARLDRLKAETDAQRSGTPLEIVVLRARNKDDLKMTHAKYFGDAALRENIRSMTR
jgi:hypothetical protein